MCFDTVSVYRLYTLYIIKFPIMACGVFASMKKSTGKFNDTMHDFKMINGNIGLI